MVLYSPENAYGSSSYGFKTKRGQVLKRYKALETDRSSWRSHWIEIADYITPRRGRFLLESRNTKGRKRTTKIIDNTATQALRTMSAGMMSGLTNPARPWFRLATPDPDRDDHQTVKEWLDQAARATRIVLRNSNFYNAVHTFYTETGAFGTGALYRHPAKDPRKLAVYRPLTAGEYVIAEDEDGVIDTLGREFTMTVSQIVERFVANPADPRDVDFSKVSRAVKQMWDAGNYDMEIQVVHMIQPRRATIPGRDDNLNKPFLDCYFEYGAEGDQLLRESGHDKRPFYVGRWDVLGGDVYGRGPGMDHLADVKQLQHEQKRKAQAIDKMVNPPMTAPPSLKGKPTSTLPGGTTYVDQVSGNGFAPAYLPQPRIQEMLLDIQEVQERINRGFYADLFAMMIMSDRRQITATEVAERHEEKLVLLGPVLQRLNVEVFNAVVEDAFEIAYNAGMIGPAPEELQGVDLEIQYISLLAQAQEAVAAGALERGMSFAANFAQVKPNILDVVNEDEALRQYFDIIGAPPTLLHDQDTVEGVREARRQAEQQQMAMDQAEQGAGVAQALGNIDTQDPNALTRIMRGGQSG